jgi:hypothetical protein
MTKFEPVDLESRQKSQKNDAFLLNVALVKLLTRTFRFIYNVYNSVTK